MFPVSTDCGSREQLEALYEVHTHEVEDVLHRVEQVKEQAAQQKKQLLRQLLLINAEQGLAMLENTQSTKDLGK